MTKIHNRAVLAGFALAASTFASAVTYGNTSPFETMSAHSPNYVLGVQVNIPQAIILQSFGVIYGLEGQGPATSNAIYGLYSSDGNGMPLNLVAVTNPITLSASQTYDNIAFTSNPTVGAGTYWMMSMYESFANPRMGLTDPNSLVAYWSNSYGSGMPGTAPTATTYSGQNFNYWVNGSPVPEPASMAILGLGTLALARKRRRA